MKEQPANQSWMYERYAPLQRAASWNPFFYRFFGSDHGQVPLGMRPLSGDESCRALLQVAEACGGKHPRPVMLRRCLSQMTSSGYRPSPVYQDTFDALDQIASQQAPADSKPTVVTFDGSAWTVKKEYALSSPIKGVTQLLDPLNWPRLAPFFKETRLIEGQPNDGDTGAWSGVLEEKVAINWNSAVIQSYDAFLKIDYTIAPRLARVDYSLEYEKDNQLLVDDGYGEARWVREGLTQYTGCKRLRFASSFLNLLAPAVMCMFLEHDEDGFRDVLEQEADAMTPAAPVRAQPVPLRKGSRKKGGIRHGE